MDEYQFINKAIYLPKQKILAIGDLHLGYEMMIKETGNAIPLSEFERTKKELLEIFQKLKKEKKEVSKLVILGDIKHFFQYKKFEDRLLIELFESIERYIPKKDIILIKGNHEKVDFFAGIKLNEFYIQESIIFIHGDKEIKEINNKEVKQIIMAHLHPAITLEDSQKVKREKFKCFLEGIYKKKKVIILPSFISINEGTSINQNLSKDYCIISPKLLTEFNVYLIGEKGEIFDFGRLKALIKKD